MNININININSVTQTISLLTTTIYLYIHHCIHVLSTNIVTATFVAEYLVIILVIILANNQQIGPDNCATQSIIIARYYKVAQWPTLR